MNEPKTTQQTWLSGISNMFQFILGFLVGVALIAGSAAGAAYYYFKKVSSTVPEKPVYPEETASDSEAETEPTSSPEAVEASATQEVAQTETKLELPEGAYYASVTWPQGLSLRAEPDINAAKISGIGYNAEILILEETQDKKWQKVRVPWSEQEGWVKGGNTKRTSY